MNNENLINGSNITCSNCGASNMSNTKFCIKCGNPLQTENLNTSVESNPINSQFNTETIQPNVELQVNPNNQQFGAQNIVQPTYTPGNATQFNTGSMNYFKYMLNAILKPFDSFKKEETNLSSFKNSGILVAIIVIALTILNLISTIIKSVRVTSFWTDEVEWVWENLKNIGYFKVIGQNLLVYAGIIFAISGVYFLASLVLKKDSKFVKLLSATTTAFIPLAVAVSVLSPLLSLINTYIGLAITIVGFIYFVVILLELLNDQIVIENKNTRIYFHLVCLSILLIGGGFIAYNLVLGSLTSGLGLLGSLLG